MKNGESFVEPELNRKLSNNTRNNMSLISNKSVKSIKLQPIKEDENEIHSSSRRVTDSNDIILRNNKVDLDVERYRIKKTLAPEY